MRRSWPCASCTWADPENTGTFETEIARAVAAHVHDLHATILRCLGIDHTKLTFKYQGRHFRLTDVHDVVKKEILV